MKSNRRILRKYTIIIKTTMLILISGCLTMGCGHRPVNNTQTHVPWDSVPLIQEQKGYSIPPTLVTIDLTKDYPTLNLKIEIKEKMYVPLETTPEILLDKDRRVMYLSEKYCVIINRQRGDVFIFNLEGKCVGNFNHRGPGPIDYRNISDIVVDEKTEEVFILTYRRDILVYTFNGKYQRKFDWPPDTRIGKIFNFNDTALLVSGEQAYLNEKSLLTKTPFILLSKKTGEVIGSLNIRPERIALFAGEMRTTTPNMLKNGKDIYLSDISSDTLYHIEQDGKLEPFLVRTPSVFDKKKQIFFQAKEKFGSYLTLEKTVNEIVPNAPQEQMFKVEYYVLNLETGEIFKLGIFKFSSNSEDTISIGIDVFPIDIVANTIVALIDADELIDGLKNGDVKSVGLKKIVSALQEEDNPVLLIEKF